MAKKCRGFASRAGRNNIRLLREGWHPRQVRRLHAPQPMEDDSEGGDGGGTPAGRQGVGPPGPPSVREEQVPQGSVTAEPTGNGEIVAADREGGAAEERGPYAGLGMGVVGGGVAVAFEEPLDEEWALGLVRAASEGHGGREGMAEFGIGVTGLAQAEGGASGAALGMARVRPYAWSIGGTIISIVAWTAVLAASTMNLARKRSRLRF